MENPGRKLNPFALPAETNARFTLLVLAIVGLSVTAGLFILLSFTESGLDFDPVLGAVPDVGSPSFFSDSRAYLGRAIFFFGRYILVSAIPLAIIFGLALLLYRRHPNTLLRKHGLSLIAPGKWPSLQGEVRQLAQTSGVQPPAIASTSRLKGQGAQAFGVRGKPMLRLDGGWRLQQRKDPAAFRAVVLHELGHWRNGDVGRTYFTQALWQVTRWLPIIFVVIAILIFLEAVARHVEAGTFDLGQILTQNLPALLLVTAQVGLLFATSGANRAGLLRVREFYADAFAAQWGAMRALQRQFSRFPEVRRNWWQRLFQLHPSASDRASILAQPSDLFRVRNDTVFWAGLLFAIIGAGLLPIFIALLQVLLASLFLAQNMLAESAVASESLVLIGMVRLLLILTIPLTAVVVGSPILILSIVVSGVVGGSLQRECVTVMARPWRRWATVALVMAAGVEIGFLAQIGGLLSPLGILFQGVALWRLILFVPMSAVLFVGIWLWLFFMGTASRWLIAAHKGDDPPKWTRRLLNAVSAIVLWICWTPAVVARVLVFSQFALGQILALVVILGLLAGIVYGGIFAGAWVWARLRQWQQRDVEGQAWLYLA